MKRKTRQRAENVDRQIENKHTFCAVIKCGPDLR